MTTPLYVNLWTAFLTVEIIRSSTSPPTPPPPPPPRRPETPSYEQTHHTLNCGYAKLYQKSEVHYFEEFWVWDGRGLQKYGENWTFDNHHLLGDTLCVCTRLGVKNGVLYEDKITGARINPGEGWTVGCYQGRYLMAAFQYTDREDADSAMRHARTMMQDLKKMRKHVMNENYTEYDYKWIRARCGPCAESAAIAALCAANLGRGAEW